VGYLESGLCNSLEQIVICDELINYVKEFMQGVQVNEETLALDVIDKVGPHGDFLGMKHTRDHFRNEWYPELFDRRNYDGWVAAGEKTLREKAQDRVEEILDTHQPEPLPEDVLAAIDGVIERAEAGS
jgi:trimethylamine--corrinoid protein Co-methyltransferase